VFKKNLSRRAAICPKKGGGGGGKDKRNQRPLVIFGVKMTGGFICSSTDGAPARGAVDRSLLVIRGEEGKGSGCGKDLLARRGKERLQARHIRYRGERGSTYSHWKGEGKREGEKKSCLIFLWKSWGEFRDCCRAPDGKRARIRPWEKKKKREEERGKSIGYSQRRWGGPLGIAITFARKTVRKGATPLFEAEREGRWEK